LSRLTARLLGRKPHKGIRWPKVLSQVTDRLLEKYGTPLLGNFHDPIKEVFYILLSARTSEVLYMRAFERLFKQYPALSDLGEAEVDDVIRCVGSAGLGSKRSEQVIQVAKRLLDDFGEDAEHHLRSMSPERVFSYLTSLPGVGPKSAFCVMMWSLDIDVLPVDINVQRIAARIGVITEGLKHYQAQQQLPSYIPEGRCCELHTVFMVHGREICTPLSPKCQICEIADLCKTGKKSRKQARQKNLEK